MFWPFRDFFILPNLLMPRHNRDIAPMPEGTKGEKAQQLRIRRYSSWLNEFYTYLTIKCLFKFSSAMYWGFNTANIEKYFK